MVFLASHANQSKRSSSLRNNSRNLWGSVSAVALPSAVIRRLSFAESANLRQCPTGLVPESVCTKDPRSPGAGCEGGSFFTFPSKRPLFFGAASYGSFFIKCGFQSFASPMSQM